MMKLFSQTTYIERRKSLKLRVGSGVLLFLGNQESSMNFKDNWYPFRQDSTFLYFFGLNLPGLAATIDIDQDLETIYGDDLSTEDTIWHGSQPRLPDLARSVGVTVVRPAGEIRNLLGGSNQHRLHFLPPYRPENTQKLAEWLALSPQNIPSLSSVDFVKAVVGLRSIKSPEEIVEICKAVNISVGTHKRVMKEARAGMKEYELLGTVTGEALRSGGNISFPPVITIDGQTLHNHNYFNTLTAGKMLLCDFGAESSMGYAGDITRTFPVGPKFSGDQKEIYQIVRDAHRAAVQALKPGIRFLDVHLLACKKLAEGLKEVGLMKGNLDEAVQDGAHALFFPCGLGHMLGLDVHDMEDLGEQYVGYTETLTQSAQFGLKSLRLGKRLERGNVLTIEPGIYFIPQLVEQWQAEKLHSDYINYEKLASYRHFGGIRIEDDFEITATGAQLLGEPLEIEVEEVEGIRAANQ